MSTGLEHGGGGPNFPWELLPLCLLLCLHRQPALGNRPQLLPLHTPAPLLLCLFLLHSPSASQFPTLTSVERAQEGGENLQDTAMCVTHGIAGGKPSLAIS